MSAAVDSIQAQAFAAFTWTVSLTPTSGTYTAPSSATDLLQVPYTLSAKQVQSSAANWVSGRVTVYNSDSGGGDLQIQSAATLQLDSGAGSQTLGLFCGQTRIPPGGSTTCSGQGGGGGIVTGSNTFNASWPYSGTAGTVSVWECCCLLVVFS